MYRRVIEPRDNWQEIVEMAGMDYHSVTSAGKIVPYWNESAFYAFSSQEVDAIESATNQLEAMCLELVSHVIEDNLFYLLEIRNEAVIRMITRSWEEDEYNVYGRFDLSYGVDGSWKLLEYNADTPTSLFEAAIVQWHWLESRFPRADQFNSIHEKLVKAWDRIKWKEILHFTATRESGEDIINAAYMESTAQSAGIRTRFICLEDIGMMDGKFVDLQNADITGLFKLYPWEWLLHDRFGPAVPHSSTRLIEPAWKMILSNKAMLALLWQMFPGHGCLLPTYFDPSMLYQTTVKKPFLSREGCNIEIRDATGITLAQTDGSYGGNFVYQAYHQPQEFQEKDGKKVIPVIGSWVIASESAGIGIREDSGITGNNARFVPHLFE